MLSCVSRRSDQPPPAVMTDKPAGASVRLARAAMRNTTSGYQQVDNCCVEALWVEINTFLALLGQTVKRH